MSYVEFLLVTCCLEPSRAEVLQLVVDNMKQAMPDVIDHITVFDNASTQPKIGELLTSTFKHVYVADKNVGYWSAVDWWLAHIAPSTPKYTYIIESDMIHYDFDKFWLAANFLDNHPDIGAVRLHEYSVENKHLYNKDILVPGSRTDIWQSHTNKVTQKPITVSSESVAGIHTTNFLTQLPALNRYNTMCRVFHRLGSMPNFIEPDFQRFYHDEFPLNAILDGGVFHCNPGSVNARVVTGSWTSPKSLHQMGYMGTRQGLIVPPSQYNVTKVL